MMCVATSCIMLFPVSCPGDIWWGTVEKRNERRSSEVGGERQEVARLLCVRGLGEELW